MAGTLYTYLNPESFRAHKILVAAQYSGADVTVVSEPPQFRLGVTNKEQQFLDKFPLGKVPAFETAEGVAIYESNAIAYYVANDQLRGGADQTNHALVLQYINFADNEILPAVCAWVFPTLGIMPQDSKVVKQAQEDIKRVMEMLNNVLATRTFLVGERVTLADITVACNLLLAYKQVLEPRWRAPYGNVNRWFTTCINQPQFKQVIGDFSLCDKMATFDAKRYNELYPKKKENKKEGKKEGKKKEQTETPPAQSKKKESDKDDQQEENEDDAPRQPKLKDPYADLPKSSFVMDQFKRCYSNEDTVTKAIPFFWENFDPEGWSIWKCDYRYNDELKMIFMSSNLVSGMFQRLDKLRKTAFASMLIIGEDNNNEISGVWVMRGQELAFDLLPDWNVDAPSYEFKKLDPSNEEHHAIVDKYFSWEGDFGGKTVQDGKIFK